MADETPESPKPPPKRKAHRSLETLQDVRRALARCLRHLEAAARDPALREKMPVEHARALVYGYSRLGELIRAATADEVLERLRAIEARQARLDEEQAAATQ